MPFETPITIKDILEKITETSYVLPSIQREFVWGIEQIEKLFDSLLRDYPIGSFLLWEIPPKEVHSYKFYKFLNSYHELESRHNEPVALPKSSGIRAVLDGQQRLTALVIGLLGSYAEKLPNKRKSNKAAYPIKYLCIDLLNPAGEEQPDFLYRIRFLTSDEIVSSSDELWVKFSELFEQLKSMNNVTKYLMRDEIRGATKKRAEFAGDTVSRFYECTRVAPSINYFLERDGSLDKVLQIFIRTNSGGTKLSYSDLLLSIATSAWKKVNARDEIHRFVDEICSINDELSFERDFVLKASLVLAGIRDIRFSVDNFNSKNMAEIENKWPAIKDALRVTIMLVDEFGYSNRSLLSSNALIPIAYSVIQRNLGEEFVTKDKYRQERLSIRRWLATVLLRGTFGSMVDTVLAAIREVIHDNGMQTFPVEAISSRLARLNRSPKFTPEEIDALLDIEYGDRKVFLILSLVYPEFDYSEPFHVDHVYPKSKLTERKLQKIGVDADKATSMAEQRNALANLQLLRGKPNQAKSNTDFNVWLNEKYPAKNDRAIFLQGNLLPTELKYSYEEFPTFIKQREKVITERLRDLLSN